MFAEVPGIAIGIVDMGKHSSFGDSWTTERENNSFVRLETVGNDVGYGKDMARVKECMGVYYFALCYRMDMLVVGPCF